MVPVMLIMGIYFYKKLFPAQIELNKKWDDVFGLL
jgi:hypothetical protein